MPETCGPGCETHFPKLISLKSSCLYFCYSQFRIYNAINPNSKWNWLLLYLNYLSSAQNRDLRPSLELWRLVHVLCWSLLDLHLIIIWSIKYGLRRYHYMAENSSSVELILTWFVYFAVFITEHPYRGFIYELDIDYWTSQYHCLMNHFDKVYDFSCY